MARAIKTFDELALIRQACAVADVALLGGATGDNAGCNRRSAVRHPHGDEPAIRRASE